MYFPLPELARLGDPLPIAASSAHLTFDKTLHVVEDRIMGLLGISDKKRRIEAVSPWAVSVERLGTDWTDVETALNSLVDRGAQSGSQEEEDQTSGLTHSIRSFLATETPVEPPTRREVRELAEMALLGPGNVLYRAVGRVFGETNNRSNRIARVALASIHGLRTYLDVPDFHLLFRTRNHRQHPGAIRQAVWDGNLESVLDEHLATLRGLGIAKAEHDIEVKALEALTKALTIGAASVSVYETGNASSGDPFRMRCHSALPFGLGGQEKESGSGELHNDSLRVSFNSPFRPHVLASTSIGQEGLDFHVWSQHVVHWDLPSNPVDLEQREGRVDRYGGLAIRRALAATANALPSNESPWRTLAESQTEGADGLTPWWVCPGASIRRTVLAPPFSKIADDLQVLRDQLSLYRLALGQSDQEALIHALQRRAADAGEDAASILSWYDKARIDLSPNAIAMSKALMR
jgi:hypothetical protein